MNSLSSTRSNSRVRPFSPIVLTLALLAMLYAPTARPVLAGPTGPNEVWNWHAHFDDVGVTSLAGAGLAISGRVVDGGDQPIPGISISTSRGVTVTTGADGMYTVTNLITGTYTLTPTVQGYSFSPPSRTVTVPPDAIGQDFVAHPPRLTYLPVVSRPCLPVYSDDFSNPASGWPIGDSSTRSMGYLNGEYRILVKPADYISWTWGDFGASDYRLEVDGRAAGHSDGAVSLAFGGTAEGFYLFEVSQGHFALSRIERGPWIWSSLIGWTSSAAIHTGTQANRLKVVRSGPNITLYINGTQVGSTWDGTYTGTWLGMESEAFSANFDGRFDNFVVYSGACINSTAAAMSPNRHASFEGAGMEHRPDSTQP